MKIQTQHILADRTIVERKASLLQTQIENKNKELKRLQGMHEFQTMKQNAICEKEKDDLLQTISSKDDTITEIQTQYERLKYHFEHLRSVMQQFEKNQSRLLEKFSTQSTQCMSVISKLSELCNKENLIRKITQVRKPNETFIGRPRIQSNALEKATISTLFVSPPQDFYKTNEKHSTEFRSPPAKYTTTNFGHDKQSSLKAIQTLQDVISEINVLNFTKDNEDEGIKLEKTQNSTEDNIFKSQTEEAEKNKKDVPQNITMQEKVESQKETPEQQTRRNEKLPALNETTEFEKHNQTKIENVTNPQYPKTERIQLTNQGSRTEDRNVLTNEALTHNSKENITMAEDNKKSEGKANGTEKILEVQKDRQRPKLEKITNTDWDIYKADEEPEYEEDIEDVGKGLESNDEDILNTIF
ncbi:hypothetical protein GDO78_022476 [Eleutherodactylus coqui]|uniref:Uncharacterized protein n=1 Tax=Eleutherodactylus coqui TaxID=57060 RepID=A0A8J6JRR5_ELECQ|nr:hypothetical protein GDO78_022476 [Eleutherodactylus coqui]